MVEKILNNTTPYGKIRASLEGSLHSSTLIHFNKISVHASNHQGTKLIVESYNGKRPNGNCL